jgi:hypothetical protein
MASSVVTWRSAQMVLRIIVEALAAIVQTVGSK